jgi:hypothetical protein
MQKRGASRGDRLVCVNGEDVTELQYKQVMALLHSMVSTPTNEGTTTTLTFRKEGWKLSTRESSDVGRQANSAVIWGPQIVDSNGVHNEDHENEQDYPILLREILANPHMIAFYLSFLCSTSSADDSSSEPPPHQRTLETPRFVQHLSSSFSSLSSFSPFLVFLQS